MTDTNILVIEGEQTALETVIETLMESGFRTTVARSGFDGMDLLYRNTFDLVVLDAVLPETPSGLDICRRIREGDSIGQIPIIILVRRGEESVSLEALESGADDCVTKPFNRREFVLRIKTVLKRCRPRAIVREVITVGVLEVNVPEHRVTVGGREITLTRMEFDLLVTLASQRGTVLPRRTLLETSRADRAETKERTIDAHIKRLRRKLGTESRLIETIRGTGYRFAEVG